MRENFQLARERMGVITGIIGEVFGAVVATTFYFTFFVPFALGAILTSDPLQRKTPPQAWLQRDPVASNLERAQRQG